MLAMTSPWNILSITHFKKLFLIKSIKKKKDKKYLEVKLRIKLESSKYASSEEN